MNVFTSTLAAGVMLLAGSIQASDDPANNPLQAERWKTRPLIVVSGTDQDPLLARVRQALAEPATRAAFVEREMVLYRVIDNVGQRDGQPLDAAATRQLLEALDIGTKRPQAILVGKDGGKKIEEGADADLQAIFATIDGMAMRRRE